MQKKQYMDQRSISPVLESGVYEHESDYMEEGEESTLAMFNQLFIDSNKLAAVDENENTDGNSNEGDVEEEIPGEGVVQNIGLNAKGANSESDHDDSEGHSERNESGDREENKENCDPNQGDGKIASDQPLARGRPSSCVFVASLCSSRSDDELCVSVTKHFAQWGKLSTVKVLRDPANRPYAFVQYTNDKDSKTAISKGHNSVLNGRNLRCEAAKVNRTLFISSKFLKTEKGFKDALEEFGEIEQLIPSDEFGNVKSNKPNIKSSKHWFCKYVYRDDAIRAFANLSENNLFHIEWAQNIETFSSNKSHTNHNLSKQEENKMKFDKFSVFVGQLSSSVTEDELINRFKRHGKIEEVTIIKKTSNTFGFVKYKEEASAASAVERENHSMFKDRTMHVQYRELHSNTLKHSPKAQGIALAPPPINLKKRSILGTKKTSDFRKISPFNHHLYPMPIPIPTKKNFNSYTTNNAKQRNVTNPYNSNSIGKRKYSKFGDVYDKLKPEIKEDSPTPPESVQTYDSHTITKSGYSPSSAVNSERSDYVASGGGNKNLKNSSNKTKNIPYFYYIPTNEVASGSNSGYYNPYQYFIPYEASPEYQSQNGYGIPFPMYYPPTNNDQEFNFEDSFETPN
ncbi:uncharacterized protein AC631_01571 [Debaryomyces fabryi]|uniref:RRM domain-containing protein n=1 Tax=Debaryomyces fabryi TaxID=58627 RepID=A0A0V1Q2X5_9ASCO|nr:uncharacterized protein AC631_01571 [Debaryomyces fabryi]KSA02682.1 hypothetical protein AC631_01571 [Debaryomyces fabryi]CUM45658.1 unnamed protein product [Debaryomyces fabryi]